MSIENVCWKNLNCFVLDLFWYIYILRVDVARALQLKAVVAMFTSKFSQSIGDRAGFQDLAQISYKKMGELDPELRIPGIEAHTKTIKTTYKLC